MSFTQTDREKLRKAFNRPLSDRPYIKRVCDELTEYDAAEGTDFEDQIKDYLIKLDDLDRDLTELQNSGTYGVASIGVVGEADITFGTPAKAGTTQGAGIVDQRRRIISQMETILRDWRLSEIRQGTLHKS